MGKIMFELYKQKIFFIVQLHQTSNRMCTRQQSQNNQSSSFQHNTKQQHFSFKCYLRTPDMQCKIQRISTDQSVLELKEKVKSMLNLTDFSDASLIKLVVNQVELTQETELYLHLFQNAIIHVLTPPQKTQEQILNSQITMKFKQPPIDCPIFTLEKICPYLNVKKMKERIIGFYRIQHHENQIGHLSESEIYLVYAGRVMTDDKVLWDYGVDEHGVITVVNGKIYAKEVTRQQAQRRVQQLKRQKPTQPLERLPSHHSSQPDKGGDSHVVLNIIQNIVHDTDSQVQGQAQDDLARSQKIINRYNSIERGQQDDNNNDQVKQKTKQNQDEDFFINECQRDREDQYNLLQSQTKHEGQNANNQGLSSSRQVKGIVSQYLNGVGHSISDDLIEEPYNL